MRFQSANVDPAYLKPGRFVESRDPGVAAFARRATESCAEAREVAIALYYAVRDGVRYDPYAAYGDPKSYSGAVALERRLGHCVPKAALLAACARAVGIPARLGFADVRNHLATPRLLKANGGDVFHWHAYTDLFLDGRWVKATPAFNLGLCARFSVRPLDFDGQSDSLFHPFDAHDRKHMEYVRDRGTYADVPYAKIRATFALCCPRLLEPGVFGRGEAFENEAQMPGDES